VHLYEGHSIGEPAAQDFLYSNDVAVASAIDATAASCERNTLGNTLADAAYVALDSAFVTDSFCSAAAL